MAAMLAAVIVVLGIAGWLALQLLGKLQVSPGGVPSGALEDEPEDPASFEIVHDVTDAANLKSFLKGWWDSGGDVLYSNDVINVLLVGVDNNDGVPGAGRSDAMMLASVSKKTKTITLLSLLRDSYCYFEAGGQGYYNRLNTAWFYGGPAGLMEAVTRLYKIRVDKYITVDFQSFPKLIDALGGVAVEVTAAEARYLNRNAKSIKRTLEPGPQRLNGTEALAYSRIRKLDSDENRTARQQKVIASILQSAREASMVQIYNALDRTLPHVRTNYARAELLALIPSAMGWLHFDVVNMVSPVLDYRGGDSSAIGGTINGMSIYIVDYPKAARQAQLALYGQSNIDLEAGRDAYIEGLFAAAQQKPPTTAAPRPTQPEPEQPTEAEPEEEPTTGRPNWPILPAWPWGGGEAEEAD